MYFSLGADAEYAKSGLSSNVSLFIGKISLGFIYHSPLLLENALPFNSPDTLHRISAYLILFLTILYPCFINCISDNNFLIPGVNDTLIMHPIRPLAFVCKCSPFASFTLQ